MKAAYRCFPEADPRAEKRYLRRMTDPVAEAYSMGGEQAYSRKPGRNPFPPGRRHDEFERGLREADPLGCWHGSNA